MLHQCRIPLLALTLLASGCQTLSTRRGHTGTLNVGDPAPELSRVHWINGAPAAQWTSGQIYVVDFWAPWCGPCHVAIPGLAQLQEDQGESVRVIGVAILPQSGATSVREFVAQHPEMTYAVAEDVGGSVERGFWGAMKHRALPGAVVVDGAGKIAWFGNPHPNADQAELREFVSKLVARGR